MTNQEPTHGEYWWVLDSQSGLGCIKRYEISADGEYWVDQDDTTERHRAPGNLTPVKRMTGSQLEEALTAWTKRHTQSF